MRQRICNSLSAAALFSVTALGGCGSDARPSTSDRDPSGPLGSTGDPPPRPQTKEECDTCAGLWAVHGLELVETCICRTRDAGRRCTDGRQCEGLCLVKEPAEFQVMEESIPPRGFYAGTCSFYDTTFGCNLMIPAGIEGKLPLAADEAAERVCID